MARQGEQDVEFYYGLDGGVPFKFAGGSFADVQVAWDECDAIDAAADPDPTDAVGPGTRHFYNVLAQTAGLDPEVAAAVLDNYEGLILDSRAAYVERLAEPPETQD